MKFSLKYLFLFLLTLFAFHISLFAAPVDTSKTKKDTLLVKYYYRQSLDTSQIPKTTIINNSLAGVQIYDPVYNTYFFPVTLGNMGMASKNQIFSPLSNTSLGFDLGMHNFDAYLFTEDNVRYYQVRRPFTELGAVLASKKEQMIEVKHYQNIKKLFNLGIDYRVISSIGQYTREKASDNCFSFTGDYLSKNKKYYATINFIHDRIKAEENGGIADTANYNSRLPNIINLTSAINHVRETDINFKHYYVLGKSTVHSPQSTATNTLNTKPDSLYSKHKTLPASSLQPPASTFDLGTISYYFSFCRQFQTYTDNNSYTGFYPNQPKFDTISTVDSIIFIKYTNAITWSPSFNPAKDIQPLLRFFFSLKSENIQVDNKYDKSYYYINFLPSGGFASNRQKTFSLMFNAEFSEGDYNKYDNKLNASAIIKFNRHNDSIHNRLAFNGYYINKTPDWTQNHYSSNYFNWNNNFKKTTVSCLNADYLYRFFNLGFNFYNLYNYIYFSQKAQPAQLNKNFYTFNPYLNFQFHIVNINYRLRFNYQYTSNKDSIHLPEYVIYQSLFYDFSVFKKALIAQIGVDFWYSSKCFADSYMPATREFYLQNFKNTGELISFDPFINLRVKHAKIFVKYQHLNTSFTHNKAYLSPFYPLEDAALKFGIIWRFFD